MKKPATLAEAAAIAQFRLAIIAPVIHGLYPDPSRAAYYERVTEKPFTLPDGSTARYSPNTISGWVSKYQRGGIEALMPTERADKGATRALPDTAIEEIHRLKQAFPRLNATSSGQSPLSSVSACGENCVRSLAPPLQTEPASLGFGLVFLPHILEDK